MIQFNCKISRNYCFEFYFLNKYLSKGVALSFNCGLCTDGDHSPRGSMDLIIANYKVFEIGFFNINHKEEVYSES